MAVIQAGDIGDLVNLALKHLGRGKITCIGAALQNYSYQRFMASRKVEESDGRGLQWQVMYRHSDSAKNVGLFEEDTTNIMDVTVNATVDWRHTQASYAFDEREDVMNSGVSRLFSTVAVRKAASDLAYVEKMEPNIWTKPASSSNTTDPFGLQYWIVANTTAGFNGGDPSGFTGGAGGLAVATYPRWNNYTDRYAQETEDDLVDKMLDCYREIGFQNPIKVPEYATADDYAIYAHKTPYKKLGKLARAQNDNLKADLAIYDGGTLFHKNRIQWVPWLDSAANTVTTPVYFVNWGVIHPVCLKGWVDREDGPFRAENQHTVRKVFRDTTWNMRCYDRRRLGVIQGGG